MKSVCPETLDKLREKSFQTESKRSPHLLQTAEKGARENPALPWYWKKIGNTKQLSSLPKVKNSIGPADNLPRVQHIHLKPQQMTPASSEKGEQSRHRLRGPPGIAEPPGHSRDQQPSLAVVMVSLLPQQQPFPLR